jgi:hypothetical protein
LAKARMGKSSNPQCWAKRIKSYGSAGLVGGASWAGFSDFFAGFTLPTDLVTPLAVRRSVVVLDLLYVVSQLVYCCSDVAHTPLT